MEELNRARAALEATRLKLVATNFGKWQPRDTQTAYEAKTDGFVAVMGRGEGDRPPRFVIWSGPDPSSWERLTRGNPWDGSVLPVPKSHWWKVEPKWGEDGHGNPNPPGDASRLKVRWLAVDALVSAGPDEAAREVPDS